MNGSGPGAAPEQERAHPYRQENGEAVGGLAVTGLILLGERVADQIVDGRSTIHLEPRHNPMASVFISSVHG